MPQSSSTATATEGTISQTVPPRPSVSTSGVTSTGPRANPTLPPTENRLMPLARRLPET